MTEVKYPRLYVSARTHAKVKRIAKKENTSALKLGEKIAKAGLKSLGY